MQVFWKGRVIDMSINREGAIANRGNLARMKKLMKRALEGERLVIGFIGGSITQGSLATQPQLCYAYHVYEWWKKTFPKSEFVYVNAGIGGTTSQFGAARVEEDLLRYRPDFVITEFSVNDDSNAHFLETYEGLVRKIYQFETKPAVLLVHNVFYHTGGNAQLQHAKIGRHYQLPCVSMQSSIYPEVVAGRIDNRDITPDDLHPDDAGHELVASVITYFLDKVLLAVDEVEAEVNEMPMPLTSNSYEACTRYQNDNYKAACRGFVPDESEQEGITDCFKNGWVASEKGAKISFEIEGTGVSVQYRKSVKKPAPIAEVVVDGDYKNAVRLDANFYEDWGDKLELDTITEHMTAGKHTVEISLVEAHADDAVPFYLVSVIAAEGGN